MKSKLIQMESKLNSNSKDFKRNPNEIEMTP